ncbi:hypothetical protein BDZ97DRAFT_1828853, partial [Flammula alnicola]
DRCGINTGFFRTSERSAIPRARFKGDMPGDIGYKYEFVPGHFAHDEADEPLPAIPLRFGL